MPPPSEDTHDDNPESSSLPSSAVSLSRSLVQQCRFLLAELDAFQTAVNEKFRRPQMIEIRQLRSNVVSELRGLEKMHEQAEATRAGDVAERSEDEEHRELKLLHALRSSNLPFYMAVWTIAKRSCCGLVAFGKRFYWDDGSVRHERKKDDSGGGVGDDSKGKNKGKTGNKDKDKKKSVFVDIVADEGEEWVKVSTISENRLLFEMAKKGWEMDDDEDEDTDGEGGKRTILRNYSSDEDDDDEDEIELIKVAADLSKAARAVRINYRHPRARIVIPKIVEGKIPEIDNILNRMRKYSVTVECGTSLPDLMKDDLDNDRDPDAVIPEQLPLATLLPNPFKRFTETLNVDCTLLLAFVSDLSHFHEIPPSPAYHRAILRQIEMEKEQPLVPTELWPAVDGHSLICTKEAVKRMREIVDTIGTDTEKKRTEIMLGDPGFHDLDRDTLTRKFQKLSDHPVPRNLMLPIRVVDAETAISAGWANGKLPSVARKVEESLSDINRSVFLYGWSTGIMTISSNRTVVKQIENIVEDNRDGNDELQGPLVWVCDTARSLVGKEKNRK
ncbi:hypothetical protein Plec18167_000395 [Paecilomyces lecythidis]|uniref:DUF1308 domain-containing protein n=1 Tax=Paecilomyces lecythidis TaxID=3004212 RepID=A0ABR3YDS7_9EURO